MLEFKRRMPRFERIPELNATNEDLLNLRTVTFNKSEITINRLRHAKVGFGNIDELALATMKEEMPNDRRTKEILDSIA